MNILITGGSGSIAKRCAKLLSDQGHSVRLLVRSKIVSNHPVYIWDLQKDSIEEEALDDLDVVLHFAGAGIADKAWTQKRKRELYNSRIETANFLFNKLKKLSKKPHSFISASAIGYYSSSISNGPHQEDDSPGTDFIASLCLAWEQAALQFEELGMRTAQVRIGLVMMKNEGALLPLQKIFATGLGSQLGHGKQVMPWIHEKDLCHIFKHLIERTDLKGAYNAVAPCVTDNAEFSKTLANTMGKPYFMPRVPFWILKMIMGERSSLLTQGNSVSSSKIISSGFHFEFDDLKACLQDLLQK